MRRFFLSTLLLAIPCALCAEDAAQRGPLRLTLKRAVEIATSPEGNTYIQLSDESVKQAKYRTQEARSALLPDIEGQAEQITAMKSIAALGLDLATDQALTGAEQKLAPAVAGIADPLLNDIIKSIPRVVGPFNSVDVRAHATQSVVDIGSIRRYQASKAAMRAAVYDSGNTNETVSATVAKAYLNALRANADVEAAQANVALAQAVLKQSENQKAAGTGTGIDVTRSKVQLSNEKQHLLAAQNDRNKSYLQLLRVMGMSLDTELDLADKLSYLPTDPITVEQARAEAFKNRPDLKAEAEREAAARLNANSVKSERLPSLYFYGDYGTTGTNGDIVSLLPTRDYGLTLRVPIFDGGRRDARRAEAASQLRQERTKSADLHEQVELDIRTSLDSLHNADEQLKVAEEGLTLSGSELTQARRRFEAGFASNLEVTDAQTKLERASDNRIDALFGYNVARVDLGQAMGNVRRMIQ
jgi:outer membrane protein